MEQLSSNERTNLHINIYNNLTYSDFNDNGEEINFLESIKYKMSKGNILLEAFIEITQRDIPFKIIKGFVYNEELFDSFDRCIVAITDSYIPLLNDIVGIIITKIKDNLYEFRIDMKG